MGPFSVDEMLEAWGHEAWRYLRISNLGVLEVQTLEGNVYAGIGDWIIRGHDSVNGDHFWPCKNSYFIEKYEPIERQPDESEGT